MLIRLLTRGHSGQWQAWREPGWCCRLISRDDLLISLSGHSPFPRAYKSAPSKLPFLSFISSTCCPLGIYGVWLSAPISIYTYFQRTIGISLLLTVGVASSPNWPHPLASCIFRGCGWPSSLVCNLTLLFSLTYTLLHIDRHFSPEWSSDDLISASSNPDQPSQREMRDGQTST